MSNLHVAGLRATRGQRLTGREIEVLTAVSMGYADGQTAAMLGVTAGTVRGHVSAITVKLGAGNRAHLVRLGFTEGYLRLSMETLNRNPIGRAA